MVASRRIALIVPLVAMLLATVAAVPAQARSPQREPIPLTENLALNGVCDFPVVTSDVAGHAFQMVFFDKDGEVSRIVIHFPGVRSRFTNIETGESVTVNNSGPVRIYPQDDGSLLIIQTGQSVAGDQGLVTGDPYLVHHTGRIETVLVPNTDPNADFPYDVLSTTRTGHTTDLCAVLAA